ncbi:hypothetical protein PAXINDRAFT_22285 [Paxillus involutus ATCC 200175]|uniref:Protein kinase domain-containing protein n=1 Tax=Paxillus involutus ATCC 200175 TaxID=664439 RepID=A0A0C9T828_PAXIN|nr:hypothetical protein PAXINDRAFT_22285 [Paxillus involutus ATCC 200175]
MTWRLTFSAYQGFGWMNLIVECSVPAQVAARLPAACWQGSASNRKMSSFITLIRELLQSTQSEEAITANIISAAVVEQGGSVRVNGMVPLTFSRAPNDVTKYIKGKGPYADDTSGGFSDVWKCVLVKPGEPRAPVAVKALRLSTKKGEILQARGKNLRAEVHIWIRLDHPNVLKLHGIADGFAPLPALVSPWIERGTLTIYLEDAGPEISTATRISIVSPVALRSHN